MNRFSANPKPPSADLLAAGKLLKGLFSGKKPRFFLYSVQHEDAPERVAYVVLDAPIEAGLRYSVPGAAWELVARYGDRDRAVDALSQLQRGNAPDEDQGPPRTLWAATGCKS